MHMDGDLTTRTIRQRGTLRIWHVCVCDFQMMNNYVTT